MGQKVQGALGGTDRLGGDLQITRGGRETAMPQQQLDRAQIGTRFQEVGGKGMAQRMGGVRGLSMPAKRRAFWQAAATASRVMGWPKRSPGNSQSRGRVRLQ